MKPDFEKFKDALIALPPIRGKEKRIPDIIRDMKIFLYLARINNSPSANKIPLSQSDKELRKLGKLCSAAQAALNTSFLTSIERIVEFLPRGSNAHPLAVQHDLMLIVLAIDMALKQEKKNFGVDKGKDGRPRSRMQSAVVDHLANIYIELTERKKATRSISFEGRDDGEFLKFVEKSFSALDIKGSARSQIAQRAIRISKKSNKK